MPAGRGISPANGELRNICEKRGEVKINHEIEFIPFSKIDESVRSDPGHGIFVVCGGRRINVGAIVTLDNVEVLLNIEIRREMQPTGYNICDLSKCFDTIEDAVIEARDFLARNRREADGN